jgi:hypothetical protein
MPSALPGTRLLVGTILRSVRLLFTPLWFASVGKGELLDRDFKAHFRLAVFSHILVRGEIALHEKHCSIGNDLLNRFSLLVPGLTTETDGDVFHAALRADSKWELSKRCAS